MPEESILNEFDQYVDEEAVEAKAKEITQEDYTSYFWGNNNVRVAEGEEDVVHEEADVASIGNKQDEEVINGGDESI